MATNVNPDELRQRMSELRSALDQDVAQVATSVRAKTNWRYYVQNYPWLIAGASTAVGFLLVPRRVEKVEQVVPDPDALARLAKQEKLVMAPESQVKASGSGGILNSLVALAFAAGSRAAMSYLGNQFGNIVEKVNDKSHEEDDAIIAGTSSKPK